LSSLFTKHIRQEEKHRFSHQEAVLFDSKSGTSLIEKRRFFFSDIISG